MKEYRPWVLTGLGFTVCFAVVLAMAFTWLAVNRSQEPEEVFGQESDATKTKVAEKEWVSLKDGSQEPEEAIEEAPEEFVFPIFVSEEIDVKLIQATVPDIDHPGWAYRNNSEEFQHFLKVASTWDTLSLIEVYDKLRQAGQYDMVCGGVVTILRERSEPGINQILQSALMHNDVYVRATGILGLANRPEVVDDDFFITACEDESAVVQAVASGGLAARMKNVDNWPDNSLVETFSDQNEYVRSAVVSAAAERKSSESYDLMLRAMVDPDLSVQWKASLGLSGVMQYQPTPTVVEAVSHADESVRSDAYAVLGERLEGGFEVIKALGIAVESEPPVISNNYDEAYEALKGIMQANFDDENFVLAMGDESWGVRMVAADAGALRPAAEIQAALVWQQLNDAHPAVKLAATQALNQRRKFFN